MPLDCSTFAWAVRIFEAATIFIALVIFWILVTDLIRCFTAGLRQVRQSKQAVLTVRQSKLK